MSADGLNKYGIAPASSANSFITSFVIDRRVILGYNASMKTAISLPDPLFDAADRFARKQKLSRSQLYARAIEEYLARHRHADVTARLDEVYATESSGLETDVSVELLRREKW